MTAGPTIKRRPDAAQGEDEHALVLAQSPEVIPPSAEAIDHRALIAFDPPSSTNNPAVVYIGRLAPSSRRVMRDALEVIAKMLTNGQAAAIAVRWSEVRYQHTQLIRTMLATRYEPATANRHLSAMRGVLREAWRLQQMTAEDFHRASDLPSVRGTALPPGRALSTGELRALFAACAAPGKKSKNTGSPGAAARDAALLAILYGGGLRRAEAVALAVDDYDPQDGSLRVRRGKGHKGRVVYLARGGRSAVEAWLSIRGTSPDAPLLVPINKGGKITMRPMTDQAVLYILRRRALQAGVKSFSPHDLRRSYISHLLDAGADIATVQRLAGHASPNTTARYDRRGEEEKKRAAELLHVPFR